ncbi:hypothetical protein ACFY5D_18665 [Paeniglutamicibacter sp. NPDC012692]|uniref:hypothetical protein n=1 Tax=Paeniglutamicibacter sp. NPDC012692 TaxID=3364388 RepID=UPI0036A0C06C
MKALLLGANGAVGGHIRTALLGAGHQVTAAGRRAPQDGLSIDVSGSDLGDLAAAAREHDVTINASGVENPNLGQAVGDSTLLDISASSNYLKQLRAVAPRASMILGVGLAPGLSTMLAASLDHVPGDDIDVALMLGAGEKHGPAAIEWTQRLIGAPIEDPPEGHKVMNFREVSSFKDAGQRRRYLRADFPDHHLLGKDRGIQVRNYFALGSPAATNALALVARIPMSRRLISAVPPFGSQRWSIVVKNRRTGQTRGASGTNQSRATGVLTARAVQEMVARGVSGTVSMSDLLEVDGLGLPGIEID